MPKLILLIARMISTLGSVLTAAAIPLYLVQKNQDAWIPLSLAGLAVGRLLSTTLLLPRITHQDARTILIRTSAAGTIALFIFALTSELLSTFLQPALVFFLSATASVLCTIDDSTAQVTLAEGGSDSRWVHLDSTLMTICRISAPGIAAALLLLTHGRLSTVLTLDAASYLIAFGIFKRLLPSQAAHNGSGSAFSIRDLIHIFSENRSTYFFIAVLALGASAYNAGMIIHLNQSGLPLGHISSMIMIQNGAMVMTGLALSKWPDFGKQRILAIIFASLGLGFIGFNRDYGNLAIGTAIMAVGMVILLQGLRAQWATENSPAAHRRLRLGAMALTNSLLGIFGAMLWAFCAVQISWSSILKTGAVIILMSGVFLVGKKDQNQVSI